MRPYFLKALVTLVLFGCSNDYDEAGEAPVEQTIEETNPEDVLDENSDPVETEETEEINPSEIDDDGDGFSELEGDCDDDNASVSPGIDEVPYDGVDNDCNEATDDDDIDALKSS